MTSPQLKTMSSALAMLLSTMTLYLPATWKQSKREGVVHHGASGTSQHEPKTGGSGSPPSCWGHGGDRALTRGAGWSSSSESDMLEKSVAAPQSSRPSQIATEWAGTGQAAAKKNPTNAATLHF